MPDSRAGIRTARLMRVRGIVQGVGFRPFVWQLARSLALSGSVRNGPEGVDILAVGEAEALEAFARRLKSEAPPRARVDAIDSEPTPAGAAETPAGFVILDSAAGPVRTAIGPDTAICADCLAEIRNPANRRHRYAFTTCTHCGPRYTIARELPYDRERTSLAPFPLCTDCAAEYHDPANRRFHAEASCCPACGPLLQWLDAVGRELPGDPVGEAAAWLRAGGIVAIKGLGGFHLACDARNAAAVAELRRRKHREEKPFALMAAEAATLAEVVEVDAASRGLLESPERPAVLLRKRGDGGAADVAFPGIAPGLAWLGLMLPYTPLQHLLFEALRFGAAGGGDGPRALKGSDDDTPVLVMTSANPGGEPLVIDNDEALARLAGIADAFLLHDRAIVARCDDSVVRIVDGAPQFVRRARGYTPQAIRLPTAGPSVLAFGGGYKNTVCLSRGDEAFVSAHVGDLDNAAACAFLDETVARLLALTGIEPECVACDRHPDLYASRAGAEFAARRGLPLVSVQHHHAHIAAVCAEHGIEGPVLGLALDGVGFGEDGGVWGGELLRVDGGQFRRLGHLAPLALPGGDRAAREPWRMAAAALHRLGRGSEIASRFAGEPAAATLATMLARGLNAPPTSSAGRLFDAAAGLLGICARQSFEGQAAMRLEGLADAQGRADASSAAMAGGWTLAAGVLDFAPLLASLADERDAGRGAARFHATLAAALVEWAIEAARRSGLSTVALGGGCWLNRVLADAFSRSAAAVGLTVLEARAVPPGDGGLSLGQAWAVQQTLRST
jgi:hydrogenase maturation protein HypF